MSYFWNIFVALTQALNTVFGGSARIARESALRLAQRRADCQFGQVQSPAQPRNRIGDALRR